MIASGSARITRSLTKPGSSRNTCATRDAAMRSPARAVVRVTERRLGDPRLVEGQRDAEQRDTPRERLLHRDCRSPAGRTAGLEQRTRLGMSCGVRPATGEQDAWPAVDDRLRRADRHDHVRVHELPRDTEGSAFVVPELDQVGSLGVVDDHLAVERTRERRREQPIELAAAGPSRQAGGDEDRLPLVRNAEVSQLLHGCSDRSTPGVDRRAGQRQRGDVGDDRRPSTPRHDAGQRRARKRKAHSVADGRADIGDRLRRRLGRHQHDRVVGAFDDEQAGAGEQWDAHRRTLVPRSGDQAPGSPRAEH